MFYGFIDSEHTCLILFSPHHSCLPGKDCNRFEFECANEGQPLVYPQCIAIYDKCDGIIHCKDNSDELNCDASAPKGKSTNFSCVKLTLFKVIYVKVICSSYQNKNQCTSMYEYYR